MGWIAHIWRRACGLSRRGGRRGDGQARAGTRDPRRWVFRDESREGRITLVIGLSISGVHGRGRSDGNGIGWRNGSGGLVDRSYRAPEVLTRWLAWDL